METLIADETTSEGGKPTEAARGQPWQSKPRVKAKCKERQRFDAQGFLDSAGVGRKVAEYGSKETIFNQGDPATSVLYIQKGSVKITVINEAGKEAVVAILGEGDFLGEGCLVGQPLRMATAAKVIPCTILVVEKSEMIRVLHAERTLSDRFIKHVLSRHMRVEQDLIDQFFNSSEKRLARALLLLAHFGEQDQPPGVVPKVSQETLAEMVGTTRSRINLFMNKFRKLGFIQYDKHQAIQIDRSLLGVVLQD
jgi:CRP/FNR family transcriptional regulator, cyclic AMP receptor protein